MRIDIKTGTLYFNEITVNSKTSISDLQMLFGDKLKNSANHDIYNSYAIRNIDNGDLALGFYYKNSRLTSLMIVLGQSYGFPAFSITDEERKVVEEKIKDLGGEKKYSWGQVYLSVDSKSGIISIDVVYEK